MDNAQVLNAHIRYEPDNACPLYLPEDSNCQHPGASAPLLPRSPSLPTTFSGNPSRLLQHRFHRLRRHAGVRDTLDLRQRPQLVARGLIALHQVASQHHSRYD